MKRIFKYSCVFVGIIILLLYFNNAIGITKLNIEKDARNSQKISDDWQVAKGTTETMSALLFYDESHKHHTFSIYVNRQGLSFGYFFRGGGAMGAIAEGIAELHINGFNERAFISMNKQQVSKVEINNGNSIQTIKIDSTKPFAFILPVNTGSVAIYDINGNLLESQQQTL